jgi:hypothetical protein
MSAAPRPNTVIYDTQWVDSAFNSTNAVHSGADEVYYGASLDLSLQTWKSV